MPSFPRNAPIAGASGVRRQSPPPSLIVRGRRLFRFRLAPGASSLANSVSAAPSVSESAAAVARRPSLAAFGPGSGGCGPPGGGRWRRRPCCNGYRCTKPHGKPNVTIGNFSLCRRHFCDFAFGGTRRAFTSRSSRTLNCPSNLIGHDHPNNRPENGTRMIRRSVGGLAIRSCALLIKGARSDAKPGSTFADRALE